MKKILSLSLTLALVASCAKNPATGQMQFNLVSDKQMEELANKEVTRSIKEEGGLYREKPELRKYLEDRIAEIVSVSEEPEKPFRLRLIDAPTINASAIPGYTMMYRGIFLLAKNEAELMAVMGHEMGHVTARHSARGMTNAALTNIALNVGLSLLGSNGQYSSAQMETVSSISNQVAALGLRSYGRKHELQADELGLRYLSKLCYDTSYVTGVFEGFKRNRDLAKKLMLDADVEQKETWLDQLASTHPEPTMRVNKLIALRSSYPECGSETHEDRYLEMIDGLAYGPRVQDGFGAKSRYYDPKFKFVMDLPEGWYFPNQYFAPMAIGPHKKVFMNVKHVKVDEYQSAEEALMLKYPEMGDVEKVEVPNMKDGVEVYTGAVNVVGYDADKPRTAFSQEKVQSIQRTFAFKDDMYKNWLVLINFNAPQASFDYLDEDFYEVVKTLKSLTSKQAKAIQPMRVKVHTVKAGESVESLSNKMSIGRYQEDFFRLYNGLDAWDDVEVGQKVKLVVDPNKNMKF